jgi:hypothetical protein
LCIDADGKLDRDFEMLYNLLAPGAILVIDDYSAVRDYAEQSTARPLGGGKNVRTFYYLNHLLAQGLVGKLFVCQTTFFGYKTVTGDVDDVAECDLAAVEAAIEEDRRRAEHSGNG